MNHATAWLVSHVVAAMSGGMVGVVLGAILF